MADLRTAGAGEARPQQGDPGRFTRPELAPPRRSPLAKLGAALVLLLLLVGVPVLLVWGYGGVPLPDGWPDREVLTRSIGTQQLLTGLVVVLWLAWLQFVVCVLVEAVSAVRGSGIPAAVPLAAPTQRLARILVATLLFSGVAVGPAAATTADADAARVSGAQQSAATAPAVPAPAPPPAPVEVGPGPDGTYTSVETTYAAGDPRGVASNLIAVEVTEDLVGKKVYVVQPHVGRHYDSLWDIAERHLGDGRRYQEVYDLNVHRPQPNGGRLHLARLIQPGWQLVMPDDAVGVERVQAPPPPPPPAPPAPPTPSTPADASGAQAVDAAAPDATGAAVEESPGLLQRHGFGAGVTGGLLLAGVVAALTRRRGTYGTPDEVDEQLRWSADPERAAVLGAALRQLGEACRAQGRPLPEVAVAELDAQELRLAVAGLPDADPPAPWRALRGGPFAWAADVDAVVTEARRSGAATRGASTGQRAVRGARPDGQRPAAPYPTLVNVGSRGDGVEVLVDLEVAPGLVSIGGDPAVAAEVLTSWAVELATSSWSDGVDVNVVGFGARAAGLAPGRIRAVERLSHVLEEVEEAGARWRSLQEALGVDGVLAGRMAAPDRSARPRVLLLAEPPAAADVGRLERLVRGARTPVAVVCIGESPAARWRLVAEADGTLSLGVLGAPVQAHRLPAESLQELLDALDAARDDAAGRAAAVRSSAPADVLAEAGGAPAPDAGPVEGRAAVEVRLLGPVRVDVLGRDGDAAEPAPARRTQLTELVVLAALHPEGLHDAVLRTALWPRGVTGEVVDATTAEAVEWLGRAGDGGPRLRRDDAGRWRLTADVRSDWTLFRRLTARAEGDSELEDLEAALALVRGTAFSGTPVGAYGWLAFLRAARDARALGTVVAHRAGTLAVQAGSRELAEALLRAGLTLVPTAELLWRDLLWLLGGEDPPASARVTGEMFATLAAHGVQLPEPETDALVERLAPAGARSASAEGR